MKKLENFCFVNTLFIGNDSDFVERISEKLEEDDYNYHVVTSKPLYYTEYVDKEKLINPSQLNAFLKTYVAIAIHRNKILERMKDDRLDLIFQFTPNHQKTVIVVDSLDLLSDEAVCKRWLYYLLAGGAPAMICFVIRSEFEPSTQNELEICAHLPLVI